MSRRSFVDSNTMPESVSRSRPPPYSDIYKSGTRDKHRESEHGQKSRSRGGEGSQFNSRSGPTKRPSMPRENMETINVELESYDVTSRKWSREKSILHFQSTSFASGGMRDAYRAWDCKVDCWEAHPMVLKMPNSSSLQNEELVRTQVIMQAKCVKYAQQFNDEGIAEKKISYVPCRLVKFLSGRWQGRFGCLEDFMSGNFVKHNTVNPDYDGVAMTTRNTPQAFSHYTFEKSGKQEIVVDVQGVGDTYTDPQLYSVSSQGDSPPYGPADWAIMGVANFFRNHQCNDICVQLGLPVIRMKQGSSPGDTVPTTRGKQTGTRPKRY